MLRRANAVVVRPRAFLASSPFSLCAPASLSATRAVASSGASSYFGFSTVAGHCVAMTEASLDYIDTAITFALASAASTTTAATAAAAAAGAAASSSSASSSLAPLLLALQPLSPLLAALVFGFGVKLFLTLTLGLYCDRALDRIANASPELQKAYLLYAEVAFNPHALRTEIEMAGTKNRERSGKIMAKHGTGQRQYMLPRAAQSYALAIALGCACWSPVPLDAAAIAGYGGVLMLNAVNVAAALLLARNRKALRDFRMGFSDAKDAAMDMHLQWAVGALIALVAAYAFASAVFFLKRVDSGEGSSGSGTADDQNSAETQPSYRFVAPEGAAVLPFLLLGVALAGALQRPLRDSVIKRNRAIANALAWPRQRPKLHGTYGTYVWTVRGHVEDINAAAETSGELPRMRQNYEKGKIQLEYDCDRRLDTMPWLRSLFVDTRYLREPKFDGPLGEVAITATNKKGMPLEEYREKYGAEPK